MIVWLGLPGSPDLVEADASMLYDEVNAQEEISASWADAPDFCKVIFRTAARDPYGLALAGLRLRR